jgi:very-short-patch-repair endonuclease
MAIPAGKLRFALWTVPVSPESSPTITVMDGLPDPDWYFDHVLINAEPGRVESVPRGSAARWQAWWRTIALAATDPLAVLACDQGFVATTRQLRAHGWADHDLRRAVRRGLWTTPARGAAAPIAVRDGSAALSAARRRHALASTAAVLTRPGYVVSGRSAAILHGLPTFEIPASPELTCAQATLGRRNRVHVHGATMTATDITTWFGAPVTTVGRTLVDLGRHDRRDALMAGDAALRERLVGVADLDAGLAGARGWPGVRQARAILALASPLAESPLESLVRLALHDDGFPPPQLQTEIGAYRVDFCWPEHRLIVEADGREKYTGDELWREKRREARLRALGWRIERVLWTDVTRHWAETRRLLIGAFPAGVVTPWPPE